MTSYWDRPAESVELGLVDSERAYVAIYSSSDRTSAPCKKLWTSGLFKKPAHWLIDDIVWCRP